MLNFCINVCCNIFVKTLRKKDLFHITIRLILTNLKAVYVINITKIALFRHRARGKKPIYR